MTTRPISNTRKAALQTAAELFRQIDINSYDLAAATIGALLTPAEQLQMWTYHSALGPTGHQNALTMDLQMHCDHAFPPLEQHPQFPSLWHRRCELCGKYDVQSEPSPNA
jgi:hypothetical protein